MTLLEILLYIALLAILLVAVSAFITIFLEARVKNHVIAEVEQQGVQVIQTITQTIRNAEGITSPGLGLSGPSLNLDVFNAADDPTIFDVSGGIIRVTEGAGGPIPLTSSSLIASGLTFRNLSVSADAPGSVRIEFTLSYNSTITQKQYNYSKDFYASATLR